MALDQEEQQEQLVLEQLVAELEVLEPQVLLVLQVLLEPQELVLPEAELEVLEPPALLVM